MLHFLELMCHFSRSNEAYVDRFYREVKHTLTKCHFNDRQLPKGHMRYMPFNESGTVADKRFQLWKEANGGKFALPCGDEINEFIARASTMAEVTLMPSPGEQFWLQVDCMDSVLEIGEAKVSVEVCLALILKESENEIKATCRTAYALL